MFILSAAAMLATVSCQKDAQRGHEGEEGTGKVTVSFGFGNAGSTQTRAYTTSTAKPTTSWSKSIQGDLLFLLVNADGDIKVVKTVTPPSDATVTATYTFTNVTSGDYTGYMLANYDNAAIDIEWDAASLINTPIDALIFKLVENTTYTEGAEEGVATAYNEPAEVFLAVRPATNVVANSEKDYSSDPFQLARVISLMRVRLNKNYSGVSTAGAWDNNDVDFNVTNAAMRIRRTTTSFDYTGTIGNPVMTNLIYSEGAFFGTGNAPAAGEYTTNVYLDTANGQSDWTDVRILPGGDTGATGQYKFNIVISGLAEAGYTPAGSAPLANAALVHWVGTVDSKITANNILELNVNLTTQGLPEVPPPTDPGSIDIGAELMPWDQIIPVEMDVR
jgi:hypothetical protein